MNTDALEFYRTIGFKQEGILEEAYYYNDEYSDFYSDANPQPGMEISENIF